MTIKLTNSSLALLSMIAFMSSSICTKADDAPNPNTRDLLLLTQWFEGQFDNEEQRWYEADRRTDFPEDQRMTRIHTIHQRIQNDKFGDHVFYVEEYKDNDPSDLIRQRFVLFESSADAGIRMRQGFFKEPEKIALANSGRDRYLDRLQARHVFFMDECDVTWHRVADQYEGQMQAKSCVFGQGEDRRYSVHNLVLSASKYWRVDATYRVSDNSLFKGFPPEHPTQMRRVKLFECDAYFYAEQREDTEVIKGLTLHSQGGELVLTRSNDQAKFTALMRDKEYPFYADRPDFIYLSLRRAEEQRSIAFTVNDPLSRAIGLRTKEFGVFCHREGYKFRESIEQLE